MREIGDEIVIDAPAQQVWDVLVDLDRYEEWNPFATRARGRPALGARLRVRIAPPGRRGMTFRPTVTAFEPWRTFRWLGRLFVPGLFDGEHVHEIRSLEDGRTRYVQRERFRGLLVPFAGRMLEDTALGFRAMNEALKARVEGDRSFGDREDPALSRAS